MALTLSTATGVVEVDHVEGEVVLTIAGSSATLSAEHAGMLADYLLAVPDEDLEDVEAEAEEEPEGVIQEPVRLMALVNTALAATVGILTLTEVFSPELGGALTVALGAWVAVAGELVRMHTTPWPAGEPPPKPPPEP